jgi:hypothetical protein
MKVDHRIIDRGSWDEINIDGWFKALIPPTWEVDDEEDVIIFDPEGFGELNITFLERSAGRSKRDIANEVVSGWAEELGHNNGYEANIIKRSKELLVVSAEFTADEPEGEVEYWRIFAVVGDKIALDINYSCDVEDREREEQVVEGIIDSIQLTGTGNLAVGEDSESSAE